jgi:putative ABC transport system permease protein
VTRDAALESPRARVRRAPPLAAAIAWRNLWRNRRRTALTSGGVAFAVFLVVVARSATVGTFDVMIDDMTSLMTGHAQLQQRAYHDDPSLRHSVLDATTITRRIAARPDVAAAAQRAQVYALVSVGEKSFAALVTGVDADAERQLSSLPAALSAGRYLENPDDVVLGAALARNLGVGVGGELVVLGTARDGSIAALAGSVVGIIDSGIADVDRTLLQLPLATFQRAFGLGDEATMIVVRMHRLADIGDLIAAPAPDDTVWLPWQALLPDVQQMMQLKWAGQFVLFALVTLLVAFSVFNSFAMTVYERTREFGMLLAVGMRPGRILGMLELEALWLALLGVAIGAVLAIALVQALSSVGIPLGTDLGAVYQILNLPDRIYPTLSVSALAGVAGLLLVAVPLAGLMPALRILRLTPVTAMRSQL